MQSKKRPTYQPDNYGKVRLYGLPLEAGREGFNLGGVTLTGGQGGLKMEWTSEQDRALSAGLIVAYAFEGSCYDLPKPKIIISPAEPQDVPDDDCGFDAKQEAGYRVWVVDKLDKCVEIELTEGTVEQVVLEANLPGRRSPASYRAVMQVAHRGGRLTE